VFAFASAKYVLSATKGAINVTLAISVQGPDKPIVTGRANLPSGTELMISLRRVGVPCARTPFSARAAVHSWTIRVGRIRGAFGSGFLIDNGQPTQPRASGRRAARVGEAAKPC
jgi:hypothetical protein